MNRPDDKNTSNIQNVRRIPWWLSIIGAIATYCTLKYVLPEIETTNQKLKDFLQLGPIAAPVLTIPFLLLGAKQLYDDPPVDKEGHNKSIDDI